MRDARSEIRDTSRGMQDIPDRRSRISDRESRIPDPVSRILKSFMNIAGWNNSLKVVMLTLLLEEELYQ